MKLQIKTNVQADLDAVKKGFDETLFKSLSPPFPRVELKRFDGSSKGDVVSLELNFIFFKQLWTSEIVEESQDPNEWLFVDEGTQLPFFLRKWRHKHRVLKSDQGSVIVDDIEYAAGNLFFDCLLFPSLALQFLYRRPIYQRVFKK